MIETKNKESVDTIAKGHIEFDDCYSLYKFIEALSSIVDEIPLSIDADKNQLTISFMDASRICIIEVIFDNPYSIEFTESGKHSINIDDLKTILKVKKNDKKGCKIVFNDPYKLLLEKTAQSLGMVKKTLNYLDADFESIPMDGLDNIEYPSTVEIIQKLLSDFFYEAGVYSEIINLEINKDGVHFTETGQVGESDIFFESDILNYHDIKTECEKGGYSLSFLNLFKPLVNIMEKNETIKFDLKTDHPLRVSIEFERVGARVIYYLAPRVEEADFDDEDEDEDEF